ncbi:hypothetical protein J437_LFUL006132 [Ladona fulva]|uniref:Uncharacterized protein n=1 Tax=Ladona fulva TaxID=123851 RepID=A0A8K0K219_LADFU|nr:hypothetical protein J437_LFUL006132 [Ladona fulva]
MYDYEDIICTKNDFTDIPSQQTALFSKLLAVFPNDSQEKSTENKISENHDSDEEMEISQDLFVIESTENHADDDSDGAEDADVNMRFIQSIVQLKSIINSRSSVSVKKFQDILELFVSSGESGLDVERRLSFQNESVSCCALRFVMRSSETNDLLKFSLQKVLSYLNQSMNSSWWDGDDDTSLISHAIKTVKQLLDFASVGNECMGFCLETCLKFVTGLVDEIYNGTEINKVGFRYRVKFGRGTAW